MGRPERGKKILLDAALKEFSERGFKRTTLEDIATRADVSKGTLYNYFSGKEEIYQHTCDYALTCWDDWACSRAGEVSDPPEKLRTLARELYYYLADHPETMKLLQRDPNLYTSRFPIFGEPVSRDGKELRTVNMLRSLLSTGIRQKVFRKMDIDKVTDILVSLFRMFVVESYSRPPSRSGNEMEMEILQIVVDGLLAK